jgi:lysophospholipase L1-like esterase
MLGLSTSPLFARPLTIVALGDSTTAGTPFLRSPIEQPPAGRGDPQAFYGYWMMRKHQEWTVLNFGVNGERTDDIQYRLNAALAQNPRYVVVLAGVNDIDQGMDPQATVKNLAAMYRTIQESNSIPVAASVLPFNRATPLQAAKIRQLNEWIEKTADRFNIPFVDLNKAARDPANPDRLSGSPEGLHPDIGAYRQMGLAVIPVIERMENPK